MRAHRTRSRFPDSGCGDPKTGVHFAVMTESIYQFVMDQLQQHKGRWPAVARGSGVPKRTLEKIARREIADPGVSHIEALATYFHNEKRRPTAHA